MTQTDARKVGAWFGLATLTVIPFLAGLRSSRPTGEQWMFAALTPFYTLGLLVRWADWVDLLTLAVCIGFVTLIAYEHGDFSE